MRKFLLLISALNTLCVGALAAESKAPARVPLTNFVSNLPLISLETKEPIAPEPRVRCTVRTLLPQGEEWGNSVTGVVRFHGASSQMYAKKSFAITFDAPVHWLGLRESAHWVLNAAFVDRSLMRHKLSYDLFRSLSSSNAPRFAAASRFVEVKLNGNYRGAYLLMERVDRSMFGFKSYATNDAQHACIYKAVDHAADFSRPGHEGYEQREPDPLIAPFWAPLDQFNRFVSSASDREFFDPAKGISARLDLDSTIDFHLLILLTSNMDGFDKNLFLARDAPSPNAGPPRFFFAPWDYDATFGRNWEGSPVDPGEWLSNHLFDRLLRDPVYRKKFGTRWSQLRAREFSVKTIDHMIDENVQTLGQAVERNAARWRGAARSYPDELTFKEDVAQMKQWVKGRTDWLDREIARRTAR